MVDKKSPAIDPNALTNDGKITINIEQGKTTTGHASTPVNAPFSTSINPPSASATGAQAWPPNFKQPEEDVIPPRDSTFNEQNAETGTPASKKTNTAKHFAKQGARFAANIGRGAASGMNNMADKILDMPSVKPLKEFKLLGKILIFIMFGLLVISILCFFRKAILWGILGLLVDVLVAVGLVSYFGISFKALLTKFFVFAAVAVTGAMLVFCFVRMIMGK